MKVFAYITAVSFLFIISCTSSEKKEENLFNGSEVEEVISTDTEAENLNEQLESDTYKYYNNTDTNSEPNQPPRIKTIRLETVSGDVEDGIRAVIIAEDPDGDDINYLYHWKHNDSEIPDATEDTLQWSDNFKKGDEITIEVIPYDYHGKSDWKFEGSLYIPNSPPNITSKPIGLVSNGKFIYKVEATDPNEDKLTYSLKDAPEDMEISDIGEVTWQYDKDDVGDYNVVIIVNDGDNGEAKQKLSLRIEVQS